VKWPSVIHGDRRWSVEQADALEFLRSLPDDSVDLLFTSPPYELARTYGIGERMVGGEAWVRWMVELVTVASPKVKGLIAINCEGQTRGYRYSCVPFLLLADLHRAGFNCRKPPIFRRVGIPGSGGPDWLRNDYEPIVCVTRAGRLPWSDNTACGHPPKWAPGREMAHRLPDGQRVNQWGMRVRKDGTLTSTDPTKADGLTARAVKPSHRVVDRAHSKREPNGEMREQGYVVPAVANPGNASLQRTYTAEEVAELLETESDWLACDVGGGRMGHDYAHENEAPFPLELPTFFVKSFCPPNGVTCDPFSGSGTTAHACLDHGRRFVGCDVRDSQVELTCRRLETVTPTLFAHITEEDAA
jgi:hypothetical protein